LSLLQSVYKEAMEVPKEGLGPPIFPLRQTVFLTPSANLCPIQAQSQEINRTKLFPATTAKETFNLLQGPCLR